MKNFLPIAALLAAGLFAQSAQAGSTLRCGSGLISLGDSRHQVYSKCGQPADQSGLGYREIVNEYGHTNDVYIEERGYGPRNGMYHYLRFEGGNLVKITSSR